VFTQFQLKRWLTGLAVAATAGFPSVAMAMPIGGGEVSLPVAPPVQVAVATSRAPIAPPPARVAINSSATGPSAPTSAGSTSTSSSFDWGDAGIGAAGAAVLLGAAAAASVSVRRRRVRGVVTG
jgi:hypothetical protein